MSATWEIREGDCIEAMAAMGDASVDAIVTDPPYSLKFMGREWDRHADFQGWCEEWATESLRVLKPGGHLLAFGGTRTYHRLTTGIEDAGFEIRDSLMWLYGSGFPKSLDVSKAIDKAAGVEREVIAEGEPVKRMIPGADQDRTGSWIKDNGREFVPTETAPGTPDAERWQGWGTALKPSHEPVVVARKPLIGTVAANVLAWGCGSMNIDGGRIKNSKGGGGGSGEADPRGCPVHGLHGLRQDDAQVALEHREGQVASDVRAQVPGRSDAGAGKPSLEGRLHGGEVGIPTTQRRVPTFRGQGAPGESAGEASTGASTSNGAAARATAEDARARPPHQRDQDRQPPGESEPDGLGEPFARASDGAAPDGVAGNGEPDSARCTCRSVGRWPANVVLSHAEGCVCVGERRVPTGTTVEPEAGREMVRHNTYSAGKNLGRVVGYADEDGLETIEAWNCAPGCPVAELDAQSGETASSVDRVLRRGATTGAGMGYGSSSPAQATDIGYDDRGRASRFFYCAKASRAERGPGNNHPTVKPIELMRWLVRLVTPPGGTVLDPFTGSGTTTGIAALREGFSFIGCEREPDYIAIARRRICDDAPLLNTPAEVAA